MRGLLLWIAFLVLFIAGVYLGLAAACGPTIPEYAEWCAEIEERRYEAHAGAPLPSTEPVASNKEDHLVSTYRDALDLYRDMDPPPDLREFHRLKEFSLAAYWEMFSHVHPYPNCLLELWLGYDPLALAYCLEDRSELWYNENSLSGFAQYEDNIRSSPVGRVLVNKGCINYHPPLPPGARVEKTLIYEG